MVWSIVSAKRRRKLAEDASRSRQKRLAVKIAWALVIAYNCVGLADVFSTIAGISSGAGEEANPLIRTVMDNYGASWIWAKLSLQLLITAMVLWFPHVIVLAIFTVAVSFNAWIVYQNFMIAGFF